MLCAVCEDATVCCVLCVRVLLCAQLNCFSASQGILTSAPPTQTHPLLQHVMTSLMNTVRESKLDTIYDSPALVSRWMAS